MQSSTLYLLHKNCWSSPGLLSLTIPCWFLRPKMCSFDGCGQRRKLLQLGIDRLSPLPPSAGTIVFTPPSPAFVPNSYLPEIADFITFNFEPRTPGLGSSLQIKDNSYVTLISRHRFHPLPQRLQS
jgi:hypothetical protein